MKFKLSIIALLLFFISGCENGEKKSTPSSTSAKTENNITIAANTTESNKNDTKAKEVKQVEVQKDTINNDHIELTLTNEQKLQLQKFEKGLKVENNNQAILFNFFTTWCPPCKAEIPHLNNLQDKFRGKLKIISVLMEDKTKEEIEAFINRYKIKFDVTYGENNFNFAKSLGGVIGIPYMVLYRADGTYATHYVGLVPEEMLENDILKVIN
ncbi:TlpA family protein disulfide reductase [Campylobacter sp. RM16187]|uniref:TlpA family protein disulfide reductase n=1 Tax=Campylobacter sp. RM16187 TaxID=1660063 RepID=UPI0021B60C69|nr:TlpA disulfide reductase family protein [Campylobacter sp. RM16187]QKG29141.1 protein disulfide reductase, TlpA family [Campylobacter sp. RM16187]